jgi:hypothetical protein
MDTLTNAPPLELTDHREMVDLAGGDPVSEMVGRPGYLSDLTVEGCLVPSSKLGEREAAVFSRSYYPVDGEERVLVDTLSGGSKAEVAEQEAAAQVERKRSWCKATGIRYIVFIDPTLSDFS